MVTPERWHRPSGENSKLEDECVSDVCQQLSRVDDSIAGELAQGGEELRNKTMNMPKQYNTNLTEGGRRNKSGIIIVLVLLLLYLRVWPVGQAMVLLAVTSIIFDSYAHDTGNTENIWRKMVDVQCTIRSQSDHNQITW